MSDEEKKIIIDEDWKSQVEREKAEAEQAASSAAASSSAPSAATSQQEANDLGIPPATLMTLLTTLGTQALLMMGQIVHPVTNKREVDLEQARHFIDLVGMLEEKTKGNRTPEESQLIDDLLHDLRMLFVQMQGKS